MRMSLEKRAFTLIELMVVISMLAILLVASYAPYGFYSNKAHVRLSGERISQAINEARILASVGASRSDGKNGDIEISFEGGSGAIVLSSIPHGGTPFVSEELIRVIPLENRVKIVPFGNNLSKVAIVYPALSPAPTIFPNTFSGVTIGIDSLSSGALSLFIPFK